MAKIPQTFIDDLLMRIDIVDLIDKRVPLKKTGANYSARCPFHQEKSPSFSVSQRKQFYYCFGCGASGNAIGFLMEHERLSFIEAVEYLAHAAGLTIPIETNAAAPDNRKVLYEIVKLAADFYEQQLRQHPEAEKAKDYLKNRGLTGKIAKYFLLGYAPSGWENLKQHLAKFDENDLIATGLLIKNEQGRTYDRFRERIIFPIRDRQGRVIGFGGRVLNNDTPKYLNSPETPIFHKGSELYGLYEALEHHRHLDEIIVVEGYMDVIALAQQGIHHAVATLGTATTRQNAERLFRQSKRILFCFDGDNAGRTAAWRALENILALLEDDITVMFAFLPEGDDPDSLVRREGADGFYRYLKTAQPLSRFLLEHLKAETDLQSLDGRARLAKLAEPYIKQIPGKLFQHSLITELAKSSDIPTEELRGLFGLPSLPTTSVTAPTLKNDFMSKNKLNQLSVMQQTLSLILQYPQQLKEIIDLEKYHDIELPGSDILIRLFTIIGNETNLNTANLLERWRDTPTYMVLVKLAMREIPLTEEELLPELNGLLNKLYIQSIEAKVSSLQDKAIRNELTPEQKKLYLELLQMLKN